jgi:hypothetical protein
VPFAPTECLKKELKKYNIYLTELIMHSVCEGFVRLSYLTKNDSVEHCSLVF